MIFERLFKYPWELFRQGEVGFTAALPVELRLLIIALAVLAAYWLYRTSRESLAPTRRRVLFALRGCVLAVLLMMVFGPVLRLPRVTTDETYVAFVLDSSQSMSIEDSASGASRFAAARGVLLGGGGSPGLAAELDATLAPRTFTMADGAQRLIDARSAKPDGDHTNYFRSLRDVVQDLHGLPLAAVVMLTDGGHNGPGSPLEMARSMKSQGIALFTVGFGSSDPTKDYEVTRVEVPPKVRRNSRVEAVAVVRCTGFTAPFPVHLRQGDAILSTMEVRPQDGKDMYQVRFAFFPEKEGVQTYNIFIKPADGEKVTANNLRDFPVDVSEERLPVLYVEGSPRTEFRFLRRALFRDADFRIVSLLRTGHGRFYVQGGDDMPELQKGFPTTKEQLYRFQAVIFGDIEAGFFTTQQLAMVEEFVKERGGGFAMLGGVNSFGLGNYKGTPCETMLPVTFTGAKSAYSFEHVKMSVPEEALQHPILHQDDDSEANKRAWDHVPELDGYNPVTGAKSTAKILAVNPKTNLPMLAVQPYGSGRVAAFCTGGAWAWRMSVSNDIEIQEKFWRQLVRWLAAGSKESVTVSLDRPAYAKGEPVILRATVLGLSLQSVNDAKVTATFQNPFGNSEEIAMPWILTHDGVYQCRYDTREFGDHLVRVRVEIPGLDPIDRATSFGVTQPFIEFARSGLNETMLKQLAEAGGGAYLTEQDAAKLPALLRQLSDKRERLGSFLEEKELWDSPFLFLLLIALLGCEWSLRRRSGMA
ncbi:MAG: VWA domain-containing protein [Planctomycetes bacterium]|nr:VWA domain-containing protein [Planctomycetota bacterium]